jgi:eukaryotic-like serine/threonine-protein kinase
MTAGTGAQLGPYTIVEPLGAGGMGEVYRAIDTRLGRTVAIKVLRIDSHERSRRERFEREARAVSRFNHPHICALYDVGDENGLPYFVMEYVEGETLARRLRRGPLPLAEVLRYAIQIADALEHAHRAGVVHRDLKPANVMLTRSGAKLLDFGLAQLNVDRNTSSRDGGDGHETVTEEGTVVGTVSYMSPEQLQGNKIDARSDIFAFGAVVYEMTTGQRAFDGATKANVIAAVLERNPAPVSAGRAAVDSGEATPPLLDAIVARCLSKDLDQRWQTASDLRHALTWIADGVADPTPPRATTAGHRSAWRPRDYLVGAALLVLVALLSTVWLRSTTSAPSASQQIVRTSLVFPGGHNLSRRYGNDYPLAVSPDGTRLAYIAADSEREQVYVRDLGELDAKPIPGSTGARHPFFSADGKWLAFFAGNQLLKVAVAGGALQRICELPGVSSSGGSWGPNDTIVFSADRLGLFKVSAAGGTPQLLDSTAGARWPDILPDGETVLFTRPNGIYAISLDGTHSRTLARVNSEVAGAGPPVLGEAGIAQARFLPTGHVVYGQDPGAIRAVSVDKSSLRLRGTPVPLVDGVYRASSGTTMYFAVSRSGLLVYAPEYQRRTLVWVDRLGRSTPITSDLERFRIPRLSPDGRRIAVAIDDETRRADIWIYDAASRSRTRLTMSGVNLANVWTPDGTRVTHSGGAPRGQLVVESAGGDGARQILLEDPPAPLRDQPTYSSAWSTDGHHLLFWTVDRVTGQDLWAIQNGKPRPLFTTPANEKFGMFSPAGNWIAYQSDESGRDEVYIARFPDLTDKTAVSTRGGGYPVWSADGRELFYRQGTAMMAVPVDVSGTLKVGPAELLFDDPSYVGTSGDLRYDVSRDGRQFVTPKADDASTSRQLIIVQNWSAEVARRVLASR